MDNEAIVRVVLTLMTMLISTTVHEYAHALAAYRLGDDYAARLGRLTLNPLAHADPIGTFLLPALSAFAGRGAFGWGKPVPYIPTNLNRKYSMRASEALIAFAGPLANLILGVVATVVFVALRKYGLLHGDSLFVRLLPGLIGLNFSLFFFNLLPVPPLDGSKVFSWLLGPRADRAFDAISQAGWMALGAAIVFGGTIIGPWVNVLSRWVFFASEAVLL